MYMFGGGKGSVPGQHGGQSLCLVEKRVAFLDNE